MKKMFSGVAVMAMLFAVGAYAATEAEKAGARHFDTHIDSWVQGTILSLDADSGKFSVRGAKLPYASNYASMEKEIAEKTANLDPAKREEKAAEIRKDWQDRLAKSKTEKPAKDSDFSFAMPAKGQLSIIHDSDVRDMAWLHEGETAMAPKGEERPISTAAGEQPKLDEKEAKAMMSLKDLKVGDRVRIGYDDGVITNEAYVVVKGGGMMKHEGKAGEATK